MKWFLLSVAALIVAAVVLTAPLWFLDLSVGLGSSDTLWELLRTELMTAAFVTALWALYVKDSRLRVHSENVLVSLVFFVIALVLGSLALFLSSFTEACLCIATRWTAFLSIEVFGCATVVLLWLVFSQTYNAVYNLREDGFFKYFKPIRYLRSLFGYGDYELRVAPRQLPDPLPAFLQVCSRSEQEREILTRGMAILIRTNATNSLRRELCAALTALIRKQNKLNVVVAGDHPLRYWEAICDAGGGELGKEVVMVDAYTPTFGFTDDDINAQRTKEMTKHGVRLVEARSLAGIHSAVAEAFNIFKSDERDENKDIRKPSVIVYANTSALCDVESVEQFRIFWRHVIPSERAYGMLCIIVEDDRAGPDVLSVLEQLVDCTVVATSEQGASLTFARAD